MNEYLQFKGKIQQRVETLAQMLQELEAAGLVNEKMLSIWTDSLDGVRASLKDSLVRIAVVGSVKSGKSTLVNALLGRDLLKRGAGIITAFITRIRTDSVVGGWVELKPWHQVREEVNANLHQLPAFQEEMGREEQLDLRRPEDRQWLQACLMRNQTEWQHTGGQLDPRFILLKGYVDGYAAVQGDMGEEPCRITFDAASIAGHQQYVGQEGPSVYVRNMQLHHPVPWLGREIEIADCQGSDSPNPLHLELLQQHLLGSHFILYVISSRTGLREADFKLLDYIKTLRMFPQTFFVLNVDLDAHPHEADLLALVERVRNELAWVVPKPVLFAFSGLYHLMDGLGEDLPLREARRLDLWKEDAGLARFTEGDFQAFRGELRRRIGAQRVRVLLGSGLSRLSMVAASVLDTAQARKRSIDADLGGLHQLGEQLRVKQKALHSTLGTLKNAISGLQDSLKQEMDVAADHYFNPDAGTLVRETLEMVEHYPIDPQYRRRLADYRQFVHELYRFYQEFRQSVWRYLVEKVNVRAIDFAKEQEAFLHERLSESSRAFWALFGIALADYRREMAGFNAELRTAGDLCHYPWSSADGVAPPSFSPYLDQEGLGRGVLLMKFGLGRFTRFLTGIKARMGKEKNLLQWKSQDSETLQEAVCLVKSETRSELLHAFHEYRKNFKNGYLHRLLGEMTQILQEEFRVRADMTQLDFAGILRQSQVEGEERARLRDLLIRTAEVAGGLVEELDELRCLVQLEWLAPGEEASQPEQEPLR